MALKRLTSAQIAVLNQITRNNYRDPADRSYIAARGLFWMGLARNFLQCSRQAMERYLKAVLLYNQRPVVRACSLNALLAKLIKEVSDIELDLSPVTHTFIQLLETYHEQTDSAALVHMEGKEIFDLDLAVWEIRRYCRYLRGSKPALKGDGDGTLVDFLAEVQDPEHRKQPHRFRPINGGYLENVLQRGTNSMLRQALMHKNSFFVAGEKAILSRSPIRGKELEPLWLQSPTDIEFAAEYLDFSKKFCENFRKRHKLS